MDHLRKTISILGIIFAFFVLYFLQINFFNWFNIAGVKPNLFVVLVLYLGLFLGKNFATYQAAIWALDLSDDIVPIKKEEYYKIPTIKALVDIMSR